MNAINNDNNVISTLDRILEHKIKETEDMKLSEKGTASENVPGAKGLFLNDYCSEKSRHFAMSTFIVGRDQVIGPSKREAWNSLTEIQKYNIGLIAHKGFDSFEESIITKAFIIQMQSHFNDDWYVSLKGNKDQDYFFPYFYKKWLCIKQKQHKPYGGRNNSSFLNRRRHRNDEDNSFYSSNINDEVEEGEVNPSEFFVAPQSPRSNANGVPSGIQSPNSSAVNAHEAQSEERAQFSPIQEERKEEPINILQLLNQQFSGSNSAQNPGREPNKPVIENGPQVEQPKSTTLAIPQTFGQTLGANAPKEIPQSKEEEKAPVQQTSEKPEENPFGPLDDSQAQNPPHVDKKSDTQKEISMFETPSGEKAETPIDDEEKEEDTPTTKKGESKTKAPKDTAKKNSRNQRKKK